MGEGVKSLWNFQVGAVDTGGPHSGVQGALARHLVGLHKPKVSAATGTAGKRRGDGGAK
jgi:hypothetical protein